MMRKRSGFSCNSSSGIDIAGRALRSPASPPRPQRPNPRLPKPSQEAARSYKCYIFGPRMGAGCAAVSCRVMAAADSKGRDGKAAEWRTGFASPSLHSTKAYTWANGDISHGVDDTYSPTNSSTQVFNIQFLKTDTDKAFAVAQEHGGDKLWQKEPDTPVLYVLDWNRQENALLWHVIYGADRDTAKLRVAVNASTGEFARVEK